MIRLRCAFALSLLVACDKSIDVRSDATPHTDAGSRDAGGPRPDATAPDARVPDASSPDAEPEDAAAEDAAAPDLGFADADPEDAESAETGPEDAGAPDAEPADAGDSDASTVDAGPSTCIQALHGDHYLRTDGTVVHWDSAQVVITVTGGAPLGEVTEIYSGGAHGCARRGDGTVWCWPTGSSGDGSGQLGDGTITASIDPSAYFIATQVYTAVGLPLTQVEHLSSGSSRGYMATNTCATRENGSLWCWGSPDSSGGGGGTLFNDGLAGARPFAVEILAAASTSLTGVRAVSQGTRHACLLRDGATTGEVWCWGANVGGPLGQGDQTGRTYPTQVVLPGPADQIGAGADATCARIADAIYCWGSNNSGQVGIGTPSDPANHDGCINFCKLTPTRVVDSSGAPLVDAVGLNVGYLSSCAKKADHSLWCWGYRDSVSIENRAVQAVIGAKTLDDIALFSTEGTNGYAQTLLYLERDAELFRITVPTTPLCP